jgi:hypothetical protein
MAICAVGPALAAPSLQGSVGFDYSVGRYGATQDTQVIVEPVVLKLVDGPWTFRALVPFASIQGPGDVSVVIDEAGGETIDNAAEETGEPGGGQAATRVRSGISDVSLSATRSFDRIARSPLYVDVSGRVRLPTGDRHAGLGVGATDWFAIVEGGGDWRWGGAYAQFGRRFLGDVGRDVRRNGWQTTLGGWVNISPRVELGASYDWRTSPFADVPAYRLGEGYVSWRLSRELRLQVFVGSGLSSSSPRIDTGLTLTWRPQGRHRRALR